MYYLAAGAIFRHENCWLDEWIRYHRALGVEHFYLYNHDDDTHVSDKMLRPYVEERLVEHFHVVDQEGIVSRERRLHQCYAIQDAVRRASGQARWLAIIDLDEFVLPRNVDDIRTVLESYERHGSLVMSWANFGSNGHIKRPPTQINHLLRRGVDSCRMNRFVKSIVRPDTINLEAIRKNVRRLTPHKYLSDAADMVDENHRRSVGNFYSDYSDRVIRVNHYPIRSYQDYWDVKVPRGKFTSDWPRNESFWEEHDRNDVFDDEISRRFGHLIE